MRNGITYEGRVVAREGKPIRFGQANGTTILGPLTLAEDHRAKVGRVRKMGQAYAEKIRREEERRGALSDDEYMTFETSWHQLTLIGDKAEALAGNPEFGQGALLVVERVPYAEESPWETRDGVKRAGRPEATGQHDDGKVSIKFAKRDDAPEVWDGISDIPDLPKRGGGGGGASREYGEDEGF